MLIAIVTISYILAINVFGFRIVKIQRADRAKNGEPTPTPTMQLESKSTSQEEGTPKEEGQTTVAIETKKPETTPAKSQTKTSKKRVSKTKATPHNGDKLKKEALLADEKLNFKRYEAIPDLKILLVALFGGAIGEFVAFLIFKYRTTNTLLMVALPVLISLWVYLFYILVGGIFII